MAPWNFGVDSRKYIQKKHYGWAKCSVMRVGQETLKMNYRKSFYSRKERLSPWKINVVESEDLREITMK